SNPNGSNPLGRNFVDFGLGGNAVGSLDGTKFFNTTPGDILQFRGLFQTPTTRNVDKRPYPTFVKAYMHNGVLKSLEEVVHFYNTRDALPSCPQGSPGEKVTCWPPSEIEANKDMTIGHLGLSEKEENQLVEFLE